MRIKLQWNAFGVHLGGLDITVDGNTIAAASAPAGVIGEVVSETLGEVSRYWVDRSMRRSRVRNWFKK